MGRPFTDVPITCQSGEMPGAGGGDAGAGAGGEGEALDALVSEAGGDAVAVSEFCGPQAATKIMQHNPIELANRRVDGVSTKEFHRTAGLRIPSSHKHRYRAGTR